LGLGLVLSWTKVISRHSNSLCSIFIHAFSLASSFIINLLHCKIL